MDLGVIAKLKGYLRAVAMVVGPLARFVILFLGQGKKPEDIKLPLDKQSMVTNIVAWLCMARSHLSTCQR
jgi:hypothetical protein